MRTPLTNVALGDMAAAEREIAALIEGAFTKAHFGIVRIEIEPSHSLVELSTEDFVSLSARLADTLHDLLRPGDKLFTDDGWNWLVVLPDLVSTTVLTLALVKLSRALEERRDISLHGPLNPVLGGAFYPESGLDVHGLLAMTRLAAFEARRAGEKFLVGLPTADSTERRLSDLTKRVGRALLRDELDIHLQPQVDCRTNRCDSVEALLRWQDRGEWVPPMMIITAIERAGLRSSFNRWLLQRTFRCLKELDAEDIRIDYSINLTAADVHDPELADLLGQALSTWEVASERITLEITETAMVRETAETQHNLHRLKALGVRLSLDDFGTAYSTMSYLRHMPIDELKIDQIFVRRLNESETDREIVTSMIRLAHQLKLVVFAEGVESERVCEALRLLDCDVIQGYYFSPPLAQNDFVAWWKQHAAA